MQSRPFVLAASLILVACGGATTPDDSEATKADATDSGQPDSAPAPTESGACRDGETKRPSSSSDGCFYGSSHVCGDFSPPYVCVDGAFRCPQGTVPAKECWCFGMNPPQGTCSCTASGWSCTQTDAGVSR